MEENEQEVGRYILKLANSQPKGAISVHPPRRTDPRQTWMVMQVPPSHIGTVWGHGETLTKAFHRALQERIRMDAKMRE